MSQTDALGNTATYTYTADGLLASETGPSGQTTSYTYDAHGQRTSMTDALGNTTQYAYDALGRLIETVDARGRDTHNVYDAAGELPLGFKQRLALALAVVNDPELVLLDEPTAGLDVSSRVELHEVMRELQAKGRTIILATHDMAEAEKMTDRVAILLKGKIATMGSPTQLTATGSGLVKVSVSTEKSSLLENAADFPEVSQQIVKDSYAIYYSRDAGETVPAILDFLKRHDDHLVDLRVERPSLEERFLEITQPEASIGGQS